MVLRRCLRSTRSGPGAPTRRHRTSRRMRAILGRDQLQPTLAADVSRQSSAVNGSWQTFFYRGLHVCSANVHVGRYVRVGAQGHIWRLLVNLHRANRRGPARSGCRDRHRCRTTTAISPGSSRPSRPASRSARTRRSAAWRTGSSCIRARSRPTAGCGRRIPAPRRSTGGTPVRGAGLAPACSGGQVYVSSKLFEKASRIRSRHRTSRWERIWQRVMMLCRAACISVHISDSSSLTSAKRKSSPSLR
jgi:hypothetical protein